MKVTTYDIVVIGTQGVGKTILNKTIRGLEYNKLIDDGTGKKLLPKVLFPIGDKQIRIKQGWDYGGSESFRYHYNKMIKRKTVIILVFNTEKYMNDTEERDHVLGRIVGLMEKRIDLKDVYIIGSYYDKIRDLYRRNDIKSHLLEDMKKENEEIIIDDDHIRIMSFGRDEMIDKDRNVFVTDFTEIENFKIDLFNQG